MSACVQIHAEKETKRSGVEMVVDNTVKEEKLDPMEVFFYTLRRETPPNKRP